MGPAAQKMSHDLNSEFFYSKNVNYSTYEIQHHAVNCQKVTYYSTGACRTCTAKNILAIYRMVQQVM
jgi:hypothetical protein